MVGKLSPKDKAPNFNLSNQHGKKVKLADFQGSKLLVYFYPRANTPGWIKQSVAVSGALKKLDKLGVKAVGISPDPPNRQLAFDEKQGLGFDLLCDEDKKVAEAYGAYGEKKAFGVVKMGIVRSSFLIDEKGKIIEAWYKVKPDDTVPNVLDVL